MSKQFGPIWPPCEAFYIQSMLFNTKAAMESLEIIGTVMKHQNETEADTPYEGIDTFDVLNQLQNLILHAGAISKYFWPIRKEHHARGMQLREAFGIKDENPLKSRGLRDAMEHFDERLDKYLADGIVGIVFPEYFGPKPGGDDLPHHLMRGYYVDTGEFQLLGEVHLIPEIAMEMHRLHEALQKRDENGGRLVMKPA